MHIALFIDAERLMHEHVMLKRLVVGLIGEGVRVTRIVPQGLTSPERERGVEAIETTEQQMALAPRIEAPIRVMPWQRRTRAAKIAVALERHPPDVLYAVGEHAWPTTLDVAVAMNRPAAIDISSARLVRKAPRGHAARHIAAYITPNRPIADALRRRVDPDLVSHVPLGVAVPRSPQPILADPQRSISAAIVGSGRDVTAYAALLEGLKSVATDFPLQAAMELRGRHAHDIWRTVMRLGLEECISTVSEAAMHRPLLTRCDLLLIPEADGEAGSLLLECMAAGMAVVAQADPWLEDVLVPSRTAALIGVERRSDAAQWAAQIARILGDPEQTRTIGAAGRDMVAHHHRSSDQVMALARTFEQIVRGETYRFSQTTP